MAWDPYKEGDPYRQYYGLGFMDYNDFMDMDEELQTAQYHSAPIKFNSIEYVKKLWGQRHL